MTARAAAWMVVAALAAGCAGGPPLPGPARGSTQLQYEVLQAVLANDRLVAASAGAPECADRRVVATEVTQPLRDARVVDGRRVSGRWAERWTLDRCGTRVRYLVEYVGAPDGTRFAVAREP